MNKKYHELISLLFYYILKLYCVEFDYFAHILFDWSFLTYIILASLMIKNVYI